MSLATPVGRPIIEMTLVGIIGFVMPTVLSGNLLGSVSVFALIAASKQVSGATGSVSNATGALVAGLNIAGAVSSAEAVAGSVTTFTPQRVILSTDVGPDTDDLVVVSMMIRRHQLGQINLIGVSTSTYDLNHGPGLRALLDEAGLTNTLVGVWKTTPAKGAFTSRLRNRYRPSDDSVNYDDPATMMRKALAASPDGSVKIVTIGGMSDQAALLQTAADGISGLSGSALVAAKVSRHYSMAGKITSAGTEYNIELDRTAAGYVADNWPTPMTWVGLSWSAVYYTMPNGPFVNDDWHNVFAYLLRGVTKNAYDVGAMFIALDGPSPYLTLGGSNGKVSVNASTGDTLWAASPNRGHDYYNLTAGQTTAAASYPNSALAALVPSAPYTAPSPFISMDFKTGTYSGASLADISVVGAAGRTGLNADGSTVTAGLNQPVITDQGLYLGAGETRTLIGNLLSNMQKNQERTVLITVNKSSGFTGTQQLLALTSGSLVCGTSTLVRSFSGGSTTQAYNSVTLPNGAPDWAGVVKIASAWDSRSRRVSANGVLAANLPNDDNVISGPGYTNSTAIYLGHDASGNNRWTGFVEKIEVYNSAFAASAAILKTQLVADTTAPAVSSPTAYSIPENTTAVASSSVANETVMWSLTGADAAKFTIDSGTGEINFATAPDYEAPTDANADNVYTFTRTATDLAGNATNQTVNVTVTNVTEGSSEDADAIAYLDLASSAGFAPSSAERARVDALVKGLKSDGDWATLDWLNLFAAESKYAALRNLRNPAKTLAEAGGTVTHRAGFGLKGDGVASYLTFGEAYNAAGNNFSLNSATLGAWCITQGSVVGQVSHLNSSQATRTKLDAHSSSVNTGCRMNASTDSILVQGAATRVGHRTSTRVDGVEHRMWMNDGAVQTAAFASTSIATGPAYVFRSSTIYADDELAVIYTGGGVSDAARTRITARLRTYLQAVGAIA